MDRDTVQNNLLRIVLQRHVCKESVRRLPKPIDGLTKVEAVGALRKSHSDVGLSPPLFNSNNEVSGRIKDSLYGWLGGVVQGLCEY